MSIFLDDGDTPPATTGARFSPHWAGTLLLGVWLGLGLALLVTRYYSSDPQPERRNPYANVVIECRDAACTSTQTLTVDPVDVTANSICAATAGNVSVAWPGRATGPYRCYVEDAVSLMGPGKFSGLQDLH